MSKNIANTIKEIELKWQEKWQESKIFDANNKGAKKYYALDMYPYPSGSMHMGHVRNYSLGDANARYRRMLGFNVLYPIGFDSFGLPAENAAIKRNKRPNEWTENNIRSLKKQMKRLGFSFDWSREIKSHDPEYYKWNQWLFLKFLQEGLIYKDKSEVNWCPKCKTVLANEQVIEGECERCDTAIVKKKKEQWFYKITDYTDELLDELDELNWPDKVKKMQKDWVGKSKGVQINFNVEGMKDSVEVFTTRPDTIYGCTFMALAPEHALSEKIAESNAEIKQYIDKIRKIPKKERVGKSGVDTGLKAINPINGKKIPIYITEFVLMEYGTGAIMAVPGHDKRDFEFAKEHNLEIKPVITKQGKKITDEAYTGEGKLINSGRFNGYDSNVARQKITEELKEEGKAKEKINYRLKDWSISRQRYWGTPIPVVYCDKCGMVPVPEEDLPVKLPHNDIEIDVEGSPLEHVDSFVNTKCPDCGNKAKRETETLDTFADSSWYFLRYCSPQYKEKPFDKKLAKYWMPVDQYTGGIEHAVMHLLYARFFTKVLYDIGLSPVREPFKNLLNQGMVLLDGKKMSKSKGNIVSPHEVVEKYGADVARLFILSKSSPKKDLNWTDEGVKATSDIIKGLYNFYQDNKDLINHKEIKDNKCINDRYYLSILQKHIKSITQHMENMQYHYAVAELEKMLSNGYKYVNEVAKTKEKEKVFTQYIEKITIMFSPFIPHICEEIWHGIGHKNFVSLTKWPEPDQNLIDTEAEAAKGLIEKIKADVREIKNIISGEQHETIKIIVSAAWKYDLFNEMIKGTKLEKIMQKEKFKKYGKKVVSYYQELKEKHELEEIVLDKISERDAINSLKHELEAEFDAEIKIEDEEESDEEKATHSRPSKPAIVLK